MIVHVLAVGPLQANCIIVADGETRATLIVDPGGEAERILGLLRSESLTAELIVNTHAHLDHVGANAAVKDATGAHLLMHPADRPLYQQLRMQWEWLNRLMPEPSSAVVDGDLLHGQTLSVGRLSCTVLHTPGHSPGSVSLFFAAPAPLLLSGDTLFAGGIGRTDLFGGDERQELESIRRHLLTLPGETEVIPGHGSATTIEHELRFNPFLMAY